MTKTFLVKRRAAKQDNDSSQTFTILDFLKIAVSEGLKYLESKAQLDLSEFVGWGSFKVKWNELMESVKWGLLIDIPCHLLS